MSKSIGSLQHKMCCKSFLTVLFFLALGSFLVQSCGASKDSRRADINSMQDLDQLVNGMQFEIIHEYAQPLSGSQINLIGNPNFIRFQKDSVEIFLPYFGVRHIGGNYGGTNGGIEYEGLIRELQIKESDDQIVLEFEAEDETEDLNFFITLFPNGRATTSVNSSERQSISYRGWIHALPEKEN